jgi:hypothetical protein
MNVSDKITPRDIPAQLARPSRDVVAAPSTGGSNAGVARATPLDSVAISPAARARAAHAALSPERMQHIRQQISSGAYGAPQVVDAVARRILQRGDL